MRRTETLHAHSHRLCEYCGGVSLQSQKSHIAVLTWELAMPAICKTETTTCTYCAGRRLCRRTCTASANTLVALVCKVRKFAVPCWVDSRPCLLSAKPEQLLAHNTVPTLGMRTHSHQLCENIGGVSLQNHEIHNPKVTREPATPAICYRQTIACT